MHDKNPFLKITGLTKLFGSFAALKNISLDIIESEFICFLGPSGCGKTTLLRAIAGLDIQTHGQIIQNGNDVSALPPSERDFGIVFQSYALFPNLTVAKNIAYGLENRRSSKAEIQSRVAELLELVGLPDQGDKYPSQLSGGQQQRIALSRAIATSPGLLLLDEPLSALDAKVRARLRHEIKDLQRRLRVTTIMVTHDQEEALTMADRIVVMNHGVIEQVGTPREIYQQPASEFVADFIGNMNFIAAKCVDVNRADIGGGTLQCNTSHCHPGDAVTVAIRPEDILVTGDSEEETNRLHATISSLEFLGSFVRIDLVSEQFDSQTIQADLSINRLRKYDIQIGQQLGIQLPEERIQVYRRHSNGEEA